MRSGMRPRCRSTSARAWRRCRSRTRCRCWAALCTISTAADQGSWLSAPDNHFAVGPDSGVTISGTRCVDGAGISPSIRFWIVFPASGKIGRAGVGASQATPDDHFAARPHCCVNLSAIRRVCRAGCRPAIRAWIVSRAVTQFVHWVGATPDDHFITRPDCGVQIPGRGGIGSISR
jgi:hypothetical protein